MTVAVGTEHSAAEVRALAKAAVAPEQARRLLAIALILDGASRAEAARSTGMDRQTLRDWVHRFNAAGPDGWSTARRRAGSGGWTRSSSDELARCLENGPELAQDGVARWRLVDLCALVERRFGVRYQERGMGKLVRALGFSRVSARPQHPRSDPEAQAEFKKNWPTGSPPLSATRRGQTARALVPGREPDRPEGRADPAMGAPRQPAAAAQATNATRPPTSSPRCARRASAPPRSSCPMSTPRR